MWRDAYRENASPERKSVSAKKSVSPQKVAGAVGAIDFCLIGSAAAAAFAIDCAIMDHTAGEPGRYVLASLFAATLFVGAFERLGGYQFKRLTMLHWQLIRAVPLWVAAVSVLLLMAFLGKILDGLSRHCVVVWIITPLVFLLIERRILQLAIRRWVRQGHIARNIVIVGACDEGRRLIAKLEASQDKSIIVRGVFDDRKSLPSSVFGCDVLGTTDDLLHFAQHIHIDEVIVAMPLDAERLEVLFDKLKMISVDLRLSILTVADTFQVCGVSYVGEAPVFEIADRPFKHWGAAIKWTEDKVLTVFLLLFVSFLMIVIVILIKLDSRGPAFFVQERFGLNNKVIRVLKFRTMHIDREDQAGVQRTVQNDPRVTRFGRVLRMLSLRRAAAVDQCAGRRYVASWPAPPSHSDENRRSPLLRYGRTVPSSTSR